MIGTAIVFVLVILLLYLIYCRVDDRQYISTEEWLRLMRKHQIGTQPFNYDTRRKN